MPEENKLESGNASIPTDCSVSYHDIKDFMISMACDSDHPSMTRSILSFLRENVKQFSFNNLKSATVIRKLKDMENRGMIKEIETGYRRERRWLLISPNYKYRYVRR